ncbi:hypothetical protein HYFRA_00013250 [Hymenoscyphus fraxineus]|uniref:RING-type domain-containing protein n=1 Tax=Hymenoscyphus fraxineus TaxID=746836 RepID=A0A9N9L8T1_9HELO|nr:hypothetical protein HYFRA_00013250 [Hymenoscyphus fraxineus]
MFPIAMPDSYMGSDIPPLFWTPEKPIHRYPAVIRFILENQLSEWWTFLERIWNPSDVLPWFSAMHALSNGNLNIPPGIILSAIYVGEAKLAELYCAGTTMLPNVTPNLYDFWEREDGSVWGIRTMREHFTKPIGFRSIGWLQRFKLDVLYCLDDLVEWYELQYCLASQQYNFPTINGPYEDLLPTIPLRHIWIDNLGQDDLGCSICLSKLVNVHEHTNMREMHLWEIIEETWTRYLKKKSFLVNLPKKYQLGCPETLDFYHQIITKERERRTTTDMDNEDSCVGAVQTECGHIFGKKCLAKWIQTQSTCPICRARLREPEERQQRNPTRQAYLECERMFVRQMIVCLMGIIEEGKRKTGTERREELGGNRFSNLLAKLDLFQRDEDGRRAKFGFFSGDLANQHIFQ